MQFDLPTSLLAATSLLPVAGFVFLGQYLWSRNILKGEYSRKFIHMLSAIWISTWRFFLPIAYVEVMAVIMGLGVYFFKRIKIFRSIYTVKRPTYGEVSYAAGIGLTAFLFHEPAVYCLAILNLGIADGLAAVIGRKFGRCNKKSKVFGIKSFAGSSACFLFALASGAVFWTTVELAPTVNPEIGIVYVTAAALIIAAAELFADKGIDNIIIPVVTGIIFSGVV